MLLVILIGVGGGLGHFQTLARNRGLEDPLSLGLERTILPFAKPLARGCDATADFFSGVLRARSLAVENRMWRDKFDALALYGPEIDLLNQRIDILRKQLALGPLPGHERVNLDVVGRSPTEGQLILDGGSELGIKPDMPVINGEGLVGVIQTVSPGQSQAALLTAFGVKFAGIDVSRKPPELGLISGRGASTIPIAMLDPKAPIKSGDMIVTSGISAHIPYGLVIGRVISVEDDADFGTRSATIDPAVNVGTLKEVQVLKRGGRGASPEEFSCSGWAPSAKWPSHLASRSFMAGRTSF